MRYEYPSPEESNANPAAACAWATDMPMRTAPSPCGEIVSTGSAHRPLPGVVVVVVGDVDDDVGTVAVELVDGGAGGRIATVGRVAGRRTERVAPARPSERTAMSTAATPAPIAR